MHQHTGTTHAVHQLGEGLAGKPFTTPLQPFTSQQARLLALLAGATVSSKHDQVLTSEQ
jgi:hypothetical protein